ncbi:extracellular solute-binding protein [Dictyobacter formicarum]|uniref:Gfo/Idh/MocA-like oxidoreductase N-terminal domain-containing protein n=1 Tax=Dictyobacter formicarum TaxID=2778368 RepID=A0ABQ3VWQ6_9CHLR|nr:extracellular solute-binding protein [Dictyobacter formicarum]GHO89808.1 hypothetical protein KSZ_78140 [Dictyobacter formicarum]
MMTKTNGVRIAVVGLGFGEDFVPLYLQHPDVEYVAICDMNETRVTAVGDKFGITRRYTHIEDIFATDEYDAVHILTPVSFHAEHVCAVLASGKHCASAVPMATSIEDVKRIIAAQRQANKNYMMMETSVYTREFLYVKQLQDEGALGPITFLRGAHIQDLEGYPSYWQGYPPMHYITHALSPLLALAGTNASKVHCFGSGELRPDLRGSFENAYPLETALFRLQHTQLAAEITMSFFQTARSYMESFAVYGERQSFEWEQLDNEDPVLFTLQPIRAGQRGRHATATRVHIPDFAERLPREIARFTQWVPYDETDAQRSFRVGGGHGGAHPYLVHEFNGHIYCIPYVYDSFALFWNKDLFKAAGLDPNKPPTTWAELETYTQKLTKRDSKGAITQLGFAPWIGSTSAAEWPMWADGSQMWNYQTGTPTMDQAGNAAALQWEVDWAKKFGGYDQLQRFNSSFSGNTNFLGQKVAMWVGESYYLSSLQQFEPNVNFGVASFGVPRPDASHPYINGSVDGNMLAIPTGSKHPDQAWKFIEWNATTGVRDWVTREGDLSARKADITVQPTVLKEPYRSDYKIFADLLRGSNIFYNQGSPVDLYYYTERDNQFDLARRGAKSPEQALKDLQTGVQAQLTKALAHYHG